MPTNVSLLQHFWRDEAGVVTVSEGLLVGTIMVLGLVVGLTALRDSFVQELGDIGLALENIDQSYEIVIDGESSSFTDNDPGDDTADSPPNGISFTAPPGEGSGGGGGGGGE